MKKKVVIFGNGNQAKIVKQEINKDNKLEILAVYNYLNGKINISKEYKNIKLKTNSKFYAITAVGDIKKRINLARIINKKFKKFSWISIISLNSIVAKNVRIGKGTIVVSGAVINTNSFIGDHCIINTSSSIDHDTKVGNFTNVAPKAALAGNVKVGDQVFIGMGSAVKEKINIGNKVTVGAMSFVNKNCIINTKYIGIPAKKVK